ncbi:hypothetical protein HOY82DRAFT_479477 [Tuber indicum]|nr:hypothetical protein HOY82DRAFT_479477 [Tuber indicum]
MLRFPRDTNLLFCFVLFLPSFSYPLPFSYLSCAYGGGSGPGLRNWGGMEMSATCQCDKT